MQDSNNYIFISQIPVRFQGSGQNPWAGNGLESFENPSRTFRHFHTTVQDEDHRPPISVIKGLTGNELSGKGEAHIPSWISHHTAWICLVVPLHFFSKTLKHERKVTITLAGVASPVHEAYLCMDWGGSPRQALENDNSQHLQRNMGLSESAH